MTRRARPDYDAAMQHRLDDRRTPDRRRARIIRATILPMSALLAATAAAQPVAPQAAARKTTTTDAATTDPALEPKIDPAAAAAAPAASEPGPNAPMTTQAAIERRWVIATNAFRYQDFDTAIPAIRSLLYPAVLVDRARERKLREYLGAAHWWQGNKKGWQDGFASLLANFPDASLDPTFYPPQMLADLDRRRSELITLGVLDDPDGKSGPRRLVSDRPPLVLAMVPFGVGQFANRQHVKGGLFLATEAGLAVASTWLYLGNRDRGLRGERSRPHHIAQLSTGSAFWALAVIGVIDALVFRPEARASSP
jgi:hypothetical protein